MNWKTVVVFVVLSMFVTSTVFAQDVPVGPFTGSYGPLLNIAVGVGISLLVSYFKQWSFVKQYPKWVSLALTLAFDVVAALTGIIPPDFMELAKSVIAQLSGAVAFHEIVANPIARAGRKR